MAYCLDDSVLCKRPSLERRPRLPRAQIVIAVNLGALALYENILAACDVTHDTLKPDAKAMLDHLHPAAHAQNRQTPVLGDIDESIFSDIAFRRIAAIVGQVISASKQDPTQRQGGAEHPRSFHVVWYLYRRQAAGPHESYPRLVKAIAALTELRVDRNALANGNQVHR